LLACNVNALVAATANRELENKNYWLARRAATALIMASWEVKIIRSPAMSMPSWLRPLIVSWKVEIIGSPAVMSTPSLAATADGTQGHKNYSLAFDVYALVAATANGQLENKHYLLACDVCALVGRDCHSACRLH
jgi:hypothetical protein